MAACAQRTTSNTTAAAAAAAVDVADVDVVVADGVRTKSSQTTSCQCDRLARNS